MPVLIGITAGVSSGLFGIGGGVIIIPLLLFIYKFTQQVATATSLIALLLPVGAFGIWQYYRSGYITGVNLKVGLLIALGMLLGTFLGARIATVISGEILSKAFAVFLLAVAVRVWLWG